MPIHYASPYGKGVSRSHPPMPPLFDKGEASRSDEGDKKVRFRYSKSNHEQTIPQSATLPAPFAQGGLLGWYSPFAQGSHNGKRHMSVRRNPQNPARKQGNPFFPKSHIFLLFPKMAAAGERRPQFIGVFLPAKGRPPAESAFSAPYNKRRKSAPCLCFSETVQKIPRKSGGIFSE